MTTIKVAAVDSKSPFYLPKRDEEDAGWDFFCSKSITLYPSQFVQVPTNIAIALPPKTWGLLLGRSSTFYKRRLMVHQGTIDSGYRGEIMGLVFNPTTDVVHVKKGEKLFQLIIMPVDNQTMLEVDYQDLSKSKRGTRGFGSTGK